MARDIEGREGLLAFLKDLIVRTFNALARPRWFYLHDQEGFDAFFGRFADASAT